MHNFFKFAVERHTIYLRRQDGHPWPWTNDKILQEYRFTNVFRELDKTTAWFREHVRNPLANDDNVLMATILFRWFNRISTGDALFVRPYPFMKDFTAWEWFLECSRDRFENEILRDTLLYYYPDGPYITGAYVISSPTGMTKLDGVLWSIAQCWAARNKLHASINGKTLEDAWKALVAMPRMGPFMAYEVITDLRWTHLLCNAPDILTWANPGPGCRRGLSRLLGLDKDALASGKQAYILGEMKKLLAAAHNPTFWPSEWPRWEMRDVEHTLCEFDKYERLRLGEGQVRQKYHHEG